VLTNGLFSMKQGSNQAIPLNQTNKRNVANEFPKKHDHQENITDQLNYESIFLLSYFSF